LAIYEKNPSHKASACIIWLHGLGSDAKNMMGVANALTTNLQIKHVFIDAPIRPVTINNNVPMRAWYNIVGINLTDREDKIGIFESEKIINDLIDNEIKNGFQENQIFIAGFSQGGAMALFVGLRSEKNLGGLISMSAYLPLVTECLTLQTNLPIFMALGNHDPVVLPNWTQKTHDWLVEKNFKDISLNKYPMEHNICLEEIQDIEKWLQKTIIK
jgi:phospholipase/carboxylesterase